MIYTLADMDTGNFVGGYSSLEDALHDVLDVVRRFGPDSAEMRTLSLASEDGAIAEGLALAELAVSTIAPTSLRSA